METSDGVKYGLEHEDNLWLNAGEVSFCVEPFTEPHGNEVAYQRFSDLQGKTITKFTYLIKDADDIEIPVNAFVNYQLEDSYSLNTDTDVVYDSNGTIINYSLITPDDSSFMLSTIKAGRNIVDLSEVTIANDSITFPSNLLPGNYTIIFEDSKYAALKSSVNIVSGLSDEDIEFRDNTIIILKECGLTGANFISNISSVTVNGEKVNARGISSLIFDEDNKLIIDAVIEGKDSTVSVFADGENDVVISSTGYPSLSFKISK